MPSETSHRRTHIRRRPRAAADRGRSRLGDLTRPIPVERRITRRRRGTIALALVGFGVASALAISLFVLPVQTYRDQTRALEARAAQLERLETINAELATEVQRLRTDAGIIEAAREQIGFAASGQRRLTVTDLPPLPAQLPAGWPYDLVTAIIGLRTAG